MNVKNHFILMSYHNTRMNKQIYSVAQNLSKEALNENRGAFFKSIIGTLNHILTGDLVWLTRFSQFSERYTTLHRLSNFPYPKRLDDILYSDFHSLQATRKEVDSLIELWLKNDTEEGDFDNQLQYTNSQGVISRRDFGELISHLFNHQTHHRGQLTTLFSQMQYDVGPTDFLLEIPDTHTYIYTKSE
ncbi:diguanylate cyclase [Pseudoalteromonas sp. MSK9-3]|uniref:DinB family protein n=1 Tax=Pseudoalteromonas sp. MSK9-3 TaxID=1897633 RepID=UPI000E6BB489|nr:DinB family protein [Pseudoalteromonas sp. MSK9-3]RJE77579.1 diguanylate cyclase [Pseudoalteromonas sp. MSK9-3]